MHTNRRKFLKTAGAGIAGFGVIPALGGIGQYGDVTGLPGTYRGKGFRRVTPESQGVTSQSIRAFLAAATTSGISWHSFMLLRHGNVVAEGWWKPYEPQFIHSLYSLSKSFTSTAIGFLVKEGGLDVHAKVISFFPEDLPAQPGENLQQMEVRHLLTMNTGHGEDTMPKMRASRETWVRTYLSLPVEFIPGSHFLYNTGNTYMLGAIVHKLTGQTLEQYLGPRLFQPLGITGSDWETSPQGLNTAGYGLRVKTEDIAKLGQLYLQKGSWNGEAILPATWVQEATSYQTASQVNNGDWSQGYGYQFWRCTHGFYRGDGAFGQFCIVMPELDAVMVVTGQSPDMQKSMNVIWETLLPGMRAGVLAEDAAGQRELKRELAGLELPVTRGSVASAAAARYGGKKWIVGDNEFGVETLQFAFSSKGCSLSVGGVGKEVVEGSKIPALRFGWENWVLNDRREEYAFKTGDMAPMPSRIAGTATWINEHTLQLNTRFVEAIFGDRITCVFDGNELKVSFLNSVAEMAVKKTDDPRKGLQGKLG